MAGRGRLSFHEFERVMNRVRARTLFTPRPRSRRAPCTLVPACALAGGSRPLPPSLVQFPDVEAKFSVNLLSN